MGAITLRLSEHVRATVKEAVTSKNLWDNLIEQYGTVGLSGIYADYTHLSQIHIGHNDPRPQIAEFKDYLGRLALNKIMIDPLIESMMLIGTLPPRYSGTVAIILQSTKRDDLKIDIVIDAVMAEYERITNPPIVNKFSGIKRKEGNPKFHQQKTDGGND